MNAFRFLKIYAALIGYLGTFGLLGLVAVVVAGGKFPAFAALKIYNILFLCCFIAVGITFVMAFLPDLIFSSIQTFYAPLRSFSGLAQVQDIATSTVRGAAQGMVELEVTPVKGEVRDMLGLKDRDYFGAFQQGEDLVFAFYPDQEKGHLQEQFTGEGPVLITGYFQTIPLDQSFDIAHRPFGLSLRLARRMWGMKGREKVLSAMESAEARLRRKLKKEGFQTMALVSAHPLTDRGIGVFPGGESKARLQLARRIFKDVLVLVGSIGLVLYMLRSLSII